MDWNILVKLLVAKGDWTVKCSFVLAKKLDGLVCLTEPQRGWSSPEPKFTSLLAATIPFS